MKVKKDRAFDRIKVRARKRTEKGMANFGEELAKINWDERLNGLSVDNMVRDFHGVMDEMMDSNFPVRTHVRRSNTHPWLTNGLRARLKNERKLFAKQGRSTSWRAKKKETRRRIEEKKVQFVDNSVDRAEKDGPSAFFKAVKNLQAPSAPKKWEIQSLFKGESDDQIAATVAEYFARVSKEFTPLERTEHEIETNFRTLTRHEIEVRISKAKKPSSGIPGDIFPDLLSRYKHLLSWPLYIIYNKILKRATWPKRWKDEHITVIPKKKHPRSLGDCRNISCTNFWSKLLEAVVLHRLRSEIEDDPAQFGGLKGTGAGHFLAEVWSKILTELEMPGRVVNVCSIDFSKAFNRMSHAECLNQLEKLGASPTSVALVRSFLTGRKMKVKIGDSQVHEEDLDGGSPQGSVLGCYLYCVATQQLGPDLQHGPTDSLGTLEISDLSGGPLNGSPHRTPERDQFPPGGLSSTPAPNAGSRMANHAPPEDDSDGEDFVFLRDCNPWNRIEDTVHESTDLSLELTVEQERSDTAVQMVKYIDDSNIIEGLWIDRGHHHVSTRKRSCQIRAARTESLVTNIKQRADEIGVVVNEDKTQSLCISGQTHTEVTTYMDIGSRIVSSDSLTLLGFEFGPTPTLNNHLDRLMRIFRRRFWALIHWKRSGFDGDALFRLYRIYIQPIIEYCSTVYHPMLSQEQSELIESCQRKVFELAYGKVSYSGAVREKKIETMRSRRERASDKFVSKAVKNRKFASWFPRRDVIDRNLRHRRPFVEEDTRTRRAFRAPIAAYRRRANDLARDGKITL